MISKTLLQEFKKEIKGMPNAVIVKITFSTLRRHFMDLKLRQYFINVAFRNVTFTLTIDAFIDVKTAIMMLNSVYPLIEALEDEYKTTFQLTVKRVDLN